MSPVNSSGSIALIDPRNTTFNTPSASRECSGYDESASHWLDFGLKVIPIVPSTKHPALKWDPWLDGLSSEKVTNHWATHPDHEVGFIVGDGLIVFDADSPKSVAALWRIEETFGTPPKLVVNTKRGEHHYFKCAFGTFAKSDSHSTEKYPDRIDVKTGRAVVILPPSTGKTIKMKVATQSIDLSEAEQVFIDAIFQHNGRVAPRHPEGEPSPSILLEPPSLIVGRLQALLDNIDPDCGGYDDWLHVLMAIFHETVGSEDGLDLADAWSSKGKKYKGSRELSEKWRSFKVDQENPITIATLIKMVEANGVDWMAVCEAAEPQFVPCEYVVVQPDAPFPDEPVGAENPLDKFSLRGLAHEVEKQAVAQVPILGQIALKGQATIFYAAPNTGKTLITISLLIDAISHGLVDPSLVYYINVDDTGKGLAEKLHIAEEYGFHMLAEGYRDFKASDFLGIVKTLVDEDLARGVIIILDTLKKFTDLMDKAKSSSFTRTIRQFVVKGGTLVALAHTNKNPGRNGKPVYGGTSDIIDDSDCAYTLAPLAIEAGEKVVVFENIKRRGNVAPSAAYSYCIERSISYHGLLLSVRPVDETQLVPLKQAEQITSDAEVIGAITACINEGVNTKMKLVDAVAERAGISKRSALMVIEKYTGNDPTLHRWKFEVRERGAKVFILLDSTTHQGEKHD